MLIKLIRLSSLLPATTTATFLFLPTRTSLVLIPWLNPLGELFSLLVALPLSDYILSSIVMATYVGDLDGVIVIGNLRHTFIFHLNFKIRYIAIIFSSFLICGYTLMYNSSKQQN